ncbi:MAG: AAA family ATPase [Gammaproteobacteria bacterium]
MKKIVITGGTHSGKTSLITRLADRGYITVEEAAIKIITQVNELIGIQEQIEWRKRNPVAFQELVWDRMLKLEQGLPDTLDLVFYDRGLLDGFAYLKKISPVVMEYFSERFKPSANYYKAFVLETIPDFNQRRDTGRTSTYETSCETGRLLVDVYKKDNIDTIVVPMMSLDDRCEFVLKNI